MKVMAVRDLMTRDVKTCRPDDRLDAAARIMWDQDCGCLPVVDDADRVVGMLTDRDVCMAAYTQGAALRALTVSGAMSKEVHACRPEDALVVVEKLMRMHRVRRLPVVAADGRLVGLFSINDLAREVVREHEPPSREVSAASLAETLAAICEPGGAARARPSEF